MNQRREPRVQVDQPVEVTVFGLPDVQVRGEIRNVSGRGLGLELKQRLDPGAALKISLEDAFLLGEVIYCHPRGEGWYAGVELEHALYGLFELAAAMREVSEEYSGPKRPHAAQHAGRQDEE